ncbi:LexA family protein [Anaeroselena agilis]|uniref:S24 family peptidase n=1 Tax=Anaeroselena agilis TaxID=3063788 RepID=A0ABU3P2C7_9FIRM|nr:S24 family peptidase [Selenomonadales bacterium 4137-cl]
MSDITPVGELILSAIEEKGWSQRELAARAGISNTEVGKIIKKGERKKPPINNVIKIAKALGKPTEPFLNALGVTILSLAPTTSGGRVKIPIIGTVKAGYNGLAYEDFMGDEWTDRDELSVGYDYRWLKVKGDSMINAGIFDGDLALVRIQSDVENGSLAVIVIDGEEGTIKRVYKENGTLILQSANPNIPPRIVKEDYYIMGVVKQIKRKF